MKNHSGPEIFIKVHPNQLKDVENCLCRTSVSCLKLFTKNKTEQVAFDDKNVFVKNDRLQHSNLKFSDSNEDSKREKQLARGERVYRYDNIIEPNLTFSQIYDILIGKSFFDIDQEVRSRFVVNLERPNFFLSFNEEDSNGLEHAIKSLRSQKGLGEASLIKIGAFAVMNMEVFSLTNDLTTKIESDLSDYLLEIELSKLGNNFFFDELLGNIRRKAAKLKKNSSKITSCYFYSLYILDSANNYKRSLFLMDFHSTLSKTKATNRSEEFTALENILKRRPVSALSKNFHRSQFAEFFTQIFADSVDIKVLCNLKEAQTHFLSNFTLLEFIDEAKTLNPFGSLENQILIAKNMEMKQKIARLIETVNHLTQKFDSKPLKPIALTSFVDEFGLTPAKKGARLSRSPISSAQKSLGKSNDKFDYVNSRRNYSQKQPNSKRNVVDDSKERMFKLEQENAELRADFDALLNQIADEREKFQEIEQILLQKISLLEAPICRSLGQLNL